MKVFAMIVVQCAILYCVALGKNSLQSDDRAANSARMAEQRLAWARGQFETALNQNRDVSSARQLLRTACCADFDAEGRLAGCAQRDWPYHALAGWPTLGE
jgi:hypothetical protein